MIEWLLSFVLVFLAANYLVISPSMLNRLPMRIGYPLWILAVLLSALLSWANLRVWLKFREGPHESYLRTVERVGGAKWLTIVTRVALTIYTFASLMQVGVILLKGWVYLLSLMPAGIAQTITYYTIISLLVITMVSVFTLRLPRLAYWILGAAAALGISILFIENLAMIVKYENQLSIAQTLSNLSIGKMFVAWEIGTLLSMGLLMPVVLPEVNKLLDITQESPLLLHLVTVLPQVGYGLTTMLMSSISPLFRFPVWASVLHMFFIVPTAIAVVAVLALMVRALINPTGDKEEESSLTIPLMLSFSFLSTLWSLLPVVLSKPNVVLMINNYLNCFLILPLGLFLLGGLPLIVWIKSGKRERLDFALVVASALLSTATTIYVIGASIADHIK